MFNFIENLLENGDEELENLVGVAVVESLYFDSRTEEHKGILDTIFAYCGKKHAKALMIP